MTLGAATPRVRHMQVTADAVWAWFLGAPVRIALIVVTAIVAHAVLTRVVRRAVQAAMAAPTLLRRGEGAGASTETVRRDQRARAVGSLLRSTAVAVIWILAVITALSEAGVDVTPLIASAGVLGVAISLGAQSVVKDYLAGVFLVIEDQFGVGDTVALGDVSGVVEEVRMRVTRLRDDDGVVWYVRNGELIKVGNRSQGAA